MKLQLLLGTRKVGKYGPSYLEPLRQHKVFLRSICRSIASSNYAPIIKGDDGAERSRVRIGNVEIPIGKSKPSSSGGDDDFLIPSLYLPSTATSSSPSPVLLKHLQWMMTKDLLLQDMLLVGPPGAGEIARRRLALAYAELTQKPVEHLIITSDLTESDFKQRRELVKQEGGSTTVQFVDQAPVRAAKNGRLLLLDGIEKASRNVLPTINNLLENREMNLEDGRLLLPSHRVQELSASDDSPIWVPVHPDFRVIALGVPCPPFNGRSLDPPIRSRFQIRRVDNPTSAELYEQIILNGHVTNSGTGNEEQLSVARSCAILAAAMEENGKLFPFNSLDSIWRIMKDFPIETPSDLIYRAYPIAEKDTVKKKNDLKDFSQYFERSSFGDCLKDNEVTSNVSQYVIEKVVGTTGSSGKPYLAEVTFSPVKSPSIYVSTTVPTGGKSINMISSQHIVHTLGFRKTLAAMVQEHGSGDRDILLVSPKGEGKNALAREFAALLGYNTHLFAMYSDITSQDLLLRRSTDPVTGETKWEDSTLLTAARNGDVCILDGIEKLRPDVLSSLQSLMADRDLPLPDGRRIVRKDRINPADTDAARSYVPVHPSFRVVALASLDANSRKWMTPGLMSMFSTIHLPPPTDECLKAILNQSTTEHVSDDIIDSLLLLRRTLTGSVAEECGVAPLSTRNMIRAVRRLGDGNANDLHDTLGSIFLVDLLPPIQRLVLESVLKSCGIGATSSRLGVHESTCKMDIIIEEDVARIGSLSIPRSSAKRPEMVPSPKAFDIPAHTKIIHDVLAEWKNGERSFLFLGNQGTGKNKITDRICEIGNWEREYIQLHRDSTIGQLTLTPQLEDGKIVWNDSPLIRAVRDGCILVVDEADKAPVEVISVLKGLVEDGELLLADGRRVSKYKDHCSGTILMHPEFSLWVLANRPGYPFHGNDFIREIGDCFSVRVISNPDLNSEMALLQSYAPGLEVDTIRAVASSFAELRKYSDNGDISYPYSTREAIAVVKHLERFPSDGLVSALHNVLDFDSYDDHTYALLGQVFQRHGILVSDYQSWKETLTTSDACLNDRAFTDFRIEYLNADGTSGTSANPPDVSIPKFGKWDENNEAHVGGNQWAGGTGGSDTAGLGGRGGPYRLDRGHKVYQVSDEAKSEVSDEAKAAAREIAEKALKERLEEISMGKQQWSMYERFAAPIRDDVSKLRGILDAMELRSSERGWLKRQSYGEIDDTKLVDGITGDKYIYKRRSAMEDAPIEKKKHVRFVLDVSGSMYRFNGYDERLIRCLEAALLIMESFQSVGDSNKFEYSIVGHSGDSPCIQLVDWGVPPSNEMERLKVLLSMLAHSQYCSSGDFTLEAMGNAIHNVSNIGCHGGGDDGEGIVICLSDANLARYGIDPRQLRKVMEAGSQKGVKAYMIFIASFGQEAKDIQKALPVGRAYICMETSNLPRVVRDILTSQVFKKQK